MSTHALIGYTGFVGSHLKQAGIFNAFYNSTNFQDMVGHNFDFVVCAGVSAAKWVANREPEQDKARIDALTNVLTHTTAREFILISTIDVYPDPASGADETEIIDPASLNPYGRHRLELENWVREHFPLTRIVRLPALFGPGLKKNIVFDLLNQNQVDRINPLSSFQWYPVTQLWEDLQRVCAYDLKLANMFTQPLSTQAILDRIFPNAQVSVPTEPAPRYHLRTTYAPLFGGENGYIMSAEACLQAMEHYVTGELTKQAKAV